MLCIRRFEEKATERYLSGAMPGFIHVYIGQEAVAVGACLDLSDDDCVTSTHRGHGHCIAKGAAFEGMMAELYARETGYCKGRGGSMHIFDFSKGNLGANAIVGGGTPIGVGAALAFKMRKEDRVVVSFFGDGATNQGSFHESVNMASVWKLPVVFVCENNYFGLSVPLKDTLNIGDISMRAAAYGIPGITVDGMDVIAVYEAVGEATKRARRGDGPSFVVCNTYRFEGHYVGDPVPYRTKEEVEEWRDRDPIEAYRKRLIERGVLDEGKAEAIDKQIQEELERAVKFAVDSPKPNPKDALKYVYYEMEEAVLR